MKNSNDRAESRPGGRQRQATRRPPDDSGKWQLIGLHAFMRHVGESDRLAYSLRLRNGSSTTGSALSLILLRQCGPLPTRCPAVDKWR